MRLIFALWRLCLCRRWDRWLRALRGIVGRVWAMPRRFGRRCLPNSEQQTGAAAGHWFRQWAGRAGPGDLGAGCLGGVFGGLLAERLHGVPPFGTAAADQFAGLRVQQIQLCHQVVVQ